MLYLTCVRLTLHVKVYHDSVERQLIYMGTLTGRCPTLISLSLF